MQRITSGLAVYPGLIDEARSNNRQGLPVGSAYLRQASTTLRTEMLPSAHELYRIQALNLRAGYEDGISTWSMLAVILAAGALLAMLATTQVYLARASRRILNLRLALATVVLLALVGWIVVAFAQQHDALVRAQRSGSDPLALLTATRIVASRAQTNDQSIALFALGGGEGELDPEDLDRGTQAVTQPIGDSRAGPARGSGGLLHEAAIGPGMSAAAIDGIYRAYRAYLRAHQRLLREQQLGRFDKALEIAVGASGDATSTRVASAALNRALDRQIDASRKRFERSTAQAHSKLAGLPIAIPLLTALSALLALLGVRERLEEYR